MIPKPPTDEAATPWPDTGSSKSRDSDIVGILLVVTGLFFASFTGALMKLLANDLTPAFITWFRFTGYFVILLPVVCWRPGYRALRPVRPAMQIIRGLCLAGSTVAFVAGAQKLAYADAIAILYCYPFLLIILASVFLRERLRLTNILGVIGGFSGVLLVMRPEFHNLDTGAVLVLLCAILVSVQLTINRKLGSVSNPLVTSLWGALLAAVVTTPLIALHWPQLSLWQFSLLVCVALSGAVGQTALVIAFSKSEASLLAPFTYSELVAAVVIGFLMFGTLPDFYSTLGIALILVCGVFLSLGPRLRLRPAS